VFACEENTSDNNYEIDASFRYPSEEGSYWEYSCSDTIYTGITEGISSLKIINNNIVPDSCGENVISLFQTDSIIYAPWWGNLIFPDSTTDAWANEFFEPFLPDTVVSDTVFYSHSEEALSWCASNANNTTPVDRQNEFPNIRVRATNHFAKPPNLQYPLTIGSIWTTSDSIDYEIIGEETIQIELKDGTSVNMNCFIITMNSVVSVYYYLSSIGLVKSSATSEPMEVTTEQNQEGTGETFTISSECTLIDYYLP
jgi:hypothetical protein